MPHQHGQQRRTGKTPWALQYGSDSSGIRSNETGRGGITPQKGARAMASKQKTKDYIKIVGVNGKVIKKTIYVDANGAKYV
jgi:hypothetical protein